MRGWIKLITAAGLMAILWLVVLPQLAKWPPVNNHLQRMQAAEIEVDAMFYSELKWLPGK
jgi:hypothetical protein